MNIKYFYAAGMGLLSSFLCYASGYDQQIFENIRYFDDYFAPFLVFYTFYFVDKYFFRCFLSISKMRAALGAGIINILSALFMFMFFYYWLQMSGNNAASFMCIPELYVFAALPTHTFTGLFFNIHRDVYIAFLCLVIFKFLIFNFVFEEKISWIKSFLLLMCARILQLLLVYYAMIYVPYMIERLSSSMSLFAIIGTITASLVGIDLICAYFCKTIDTQGE